MMIFIIILSDETKAKVKRIIIDKMSDMLFPTLEDKKAVA